MRSPLLLYLRYGDNVKIKADITSFSVLKKAVSIKISAENTGEGLVTTLEKLQGRSFEISINDLVFSAKMQSINIRHDVDLLFHTPKDTHIISRLAELMDAEVVLFIEDEQDRALRTLLERVADCLVIKKEELLYKLTTFTKHGKKVGGKKSISEISDKQKPIITDKLTKILERTAACSKE